MTIQPAYLGIGYDWSLSFSYTDGQGVAIDLTGSTIGAEVYFAYQAAPVAELTIANGGVVATDYPHGNFGFFVARATTASAPADRISSTGVLPNYGFPNRLAVWAQDALGHRTLIAIVPIVAVDPHASPSIAFPQNVSGTIVSGGPQGPAGPGVSVNGHTGTIQNLTAGDVGAYAKAEADSAALIQALIFG